MKKLLAVGVIVLFLGVAIAPSINANVSKASIDSELVEITTEVCGLNGGKHTVLLSKEDAEEVEQLFDSIRERLNATETREETEKIFNEAVVELERYGLLGGLSVKQAQRLVTVPYTNIDKLKSLDKELINNLNISKSNYFCLISGRADLMYCVHRTNIWLLSAIGIMLTLLVSIGMGLLTLLAPILPSDAILGAFYLYLGIMFASLLTWVTLGQITHWNPVSLFNMFGMGFYTEIGDELYYSNGWVNSFGLMGKQNWQGELLGNLPGSKIIYFPFPLNYLYPAIWGFNGIKISLCEDGCTKFFMGSALAIGIDEIE